MNMKADTSSNYTRSFNKLSRKSIWPAVCLMFVSIAAIVALVFGFVSLFTTFIVDMKMEQLRESSSRIEKMYQMRGEFSSDTSRSVMDMRQYLDTDENICVTDNDNNIIATSGMEYPDLSNELKLDLGSTYTFYQDRIGQNIVTEDDFNINLSKILSMTSSRFDKDKKDWMDKDMLRASCWFAYPLKDGSGYLYVREVFFIKMQETFYISLVAIAAMIILCALVCLLFINFILNVVNQRRLLKHLFTDMDTGGNSWTYFVVQAGRILQKRTNRRKSFAVVSVHLDKYRDYCACYGVAAGTDIIKSIDGYFKVKLDKDETYARHSAADFALLLKYSDKESFTRRMNTIIAEMMGLRSEQKLNFTAGAYIIEAVHNNHGGHCHCNLCNEEDRKNIHIEQAYNYAYEAAENAAEIGIETVEFFSTQLIDKQMWERKVEDNMEQALRNGEFVVYYQPKYDPVDNKLVAAEALVRWISPTEGMISPGKFIPLFEKNGFITKLDDYMFANVAKQQAEWKIKGYKTVPVSVNLSRVHFAQEDLARSICGIVDSYGVEHKLVEIEITESAFIDNKDSLLDVVNNLRSDGFIISMDDFGSGYSSLNTLKDLPLDVVKIDREFFVGEGYDDKGKLIVSSVIKLAKSMKMKVVAEGVEVEDQIDFLVKENCDMIQGFYYAKPMPADEFAKLVARDA